MAVADGAAGRSSGGGVGGHDAGLRREVAEALPARARREDGDQRDEIEEQPVDGPQQRANEDRAGTGRRPVDPLDADAEHALAERLPAHERLGCEVVAEDEDEDQQAIGRAVARRGGSVGSHIAAEDATHEQRDEDDDAEVDDAGTDSPAEHVGLLHGRTLSGRAKSCRRERAVSAGRGGGRVAALAGATRVGRPRTIGVSARQRDVRALRSDVQAKQPRRYRLRGKSGHHRAGWSGTRPGETRGKVPQKHTADGASARATRTGKGEKVR